MPQEALRKPHLILLIVVSSLVSVLASAESPESARQFPQIEQANTLLAVGDIDGAVEEIRTGLKKARRAEDKVALHSLAILVEIQRGNLDAAESHFRTARGIRTGRSNPSLHLSMAQVYLLEQDLQSARDALNQALEGAGKVHEQATALTANLEQIQKAIAFRPMPLALKVAITRADAATFLIEGIQLDEHLPTSNENTASDSLLDRAREPVDYGQSPARSAIEQLNQLGLRSLSVRKGVFHPDRLLTRVEMALLIEDILYEKFAQSRTQYLGSPSPFSDLGSNSAGFNAVINAVSRGLMQANENGLIRPDGFVSGADFMNLCEKLLGLLGEPSGESGSISMTQSIRMTGD